MTSCQAASRIGAALSALFLVSIGTSSPLAAQPVGGQGGDAAELPSGALIVLRPVPSRPAEDVGVPAPPAYVVLGGRDEVLSAVTSGLSPISDHEQASIMADAAPARVNHGGLPGDRFGGLGNSSGAGSASMVQEHASGAGGAVRDAVGVIPSALGVVSAALGGGK
ncbi:MAG: hypothetical protein FP826_05805 [Sphingomonadales bacterium]|nr:hypothetical protein [Sphingomonadales bacterium]